MPAAKRRGLAVGRGSPVYQVVCGQGGPVMPDEKTIKAASEPTINTRLGSPREWPIWGGSGQAWCASGLVKVPRHALRTCGPPLHVEVKM